MDSDPRTSAGGDDQRRIWSCVTCRRRKVKCDRRAPCCDACLRHGVDCHYPVGGRLPSRGRAPPQWSSPHHKQTDLLERLQRLEAVVTELSAQVDEAGVLQGNGQITPSSTVAEAVDEHEDEQPDEDFGRLVTGGDGRVRIAKSFWSVFCDEVDHIFQSIQDASEVATEDTSKVQPPPSTCCCHVFGLGSEASLLPPHETTVAPTQISFLLQTFKERVDPFVKVLATDALNHLCDSWSTPNSDLDPTQSSLRSSMLFAAAVALTATEVKAAFERPKQTLLAELRAHAEGNLARSKYISTKDLTVLQALIIYTSMLPYANMPDLAGPIAASTVQIAMQNGLHLEKDRRGLGDADVRQMMWLQVCFLSSRSQVADAAVSEWLLTNADVTTCSERLFPTSPEQRILLITRQIIWGLSRQMRHGHGAEAHEAETLVSAAKLAVEGEYQRRLHTSRTPLAKFVYKMSQLFFAKIEHALLAQTWQPHDKGQLSAPGPQALADASMTTLEAIHALATQPDWAPWRWQLQGLFPWAAMTLVFAQLSDGGGWTPRSERAWVLARAVVGGASDEVRGDAAAWTALGELMRKAEGHRAGEMERLMGEAIAGGGGDYMRIIEAGQRVFYSEGLDNVPF